MKPTGRKEEHKIDTKLACIGDKGIGSLNEDGAKQILSVLRSCPWVGRQCVACSGQTRTWMVLISQVRVNDVLSAVLSTVHGFCA